MDTRGKHPPPPLLFIDGVRYPPSKNKINRYHMLNKNNRRFLPCR